MRGWVYDYVKPVTVGFVAVEEVMFDSRDHALALDPVDRLRGEHRTEHRIFREILEVTPLAWVLGEVNAAASRTLNPLLQASRAIMRPLARAELGIEARPKCDARGQRGGCVFLTEPRVDDTETRVAHQERWDTETRDAGGIARAHGSSRWDTLVPGLRDHRVFSHHTNYESESLVLGHLFLNLTRPHIGRRILCGSEPSLLRHNNLLLLLLLLH